MNNRTTTAMYLTVRIDIEHPADFSQEEIEEMKECVSSEADYEFKYNVDGVKIVDTEVCGINEEEEF